MYMLVHNSSNIHFKFKKKLQYLSGWSRSTTRNGLLALLAIAANCVVAAAAMGDEEDDHYYNNPAVSPCIVILGPIYRLILY